MSDDTETNNDEQPPRPAAPRFGTSLVSLIAIVLSTAALLVSVFEVSAIREEQRIQAWPYVTVNNGYGPDGFRIVATNKGIGPARIRTHDWYFDDQPITDLDQLIASVVPNDDKDRSFSYETYSISELAQTVMSPTKPSRYFRSRGRPLKASPATSSGSRATPRTRRRSQTHSGSRA